jgi:hypothetical protein
MEGPTCLPLGSLCLWSGLLAHDEDLLIDKVAGPGVDIGP